MRQNREVYCYQHKEFITKTPSTKGAANIANTSTTTVNKIISGKLEVTRDGWIFTTEPLTDEELQNAPDSYVDKPNLKRVGKRCFREVKKQMYDVDCKNGYVGHIPAAKEEKKALLKRLINTKLHYRWMTVPEKVATLEHTIINELIDSL